jgi:hypothetical protein
MEFGKAVDGEVDETKPARAEKRTVDNGRS